MSMARSHHTLKAAVQAVLRLAVQYGPGHAPYVTLTAMDTRLMKV